MIDQERLTTNLLSSMPLTFNLLAPLAAKRERADSMLYALLSDFRGFAVETLFEHSPGRGDPRFTGDYTAFDALTRYERGDGRKGFVAFEIKYSESMREPVPEIKPHYNELSEASGLFLDPAEAALRTNPLQQLWREHLLAQSMIDNGHYDEGYFVMVAPTSIITSRTPSRLIARNCGKRTAGQSPFRQPDAGGRHRRDPSTRHGHANALHRRYCDFWLVDGEMELNAPRIGSPRNQPAFSRKNRGTTRPFPQPSRRHQERRVPKGKAKASIAD